MLYAVIVLLIKKFATTLQPASQVRAFPDLGLLPCRKLLFSNPNHKGVSYEHHWIGGTWADRNINSLQPDKSIPRGNSRVDYNINQFMEIEIGRMSRGDILLHIPRKTHRSDTDSKNAALFTLQRGIYG